MTPVKQAKLLGRKALAQLVALVALGAAIAYGLHARAPIGEDVGANAIVQAVRSDRNSPVAQVAAADVTLIAFTDYRCPACRTSHSAMTRAVRKDGKVRIVYKDWPILGPQSERAARVAIASGFQGIYPAVHDALMTAGGLSDDRLKAAVEQSGGSWAQLQIDLVERSHEIEAQLERNRDQAFGLGLNGTPAYLVGPILVRGAMTYGQFRRAIERARQRP